VTDNIAPLITALRKARTFEDAASTTLAAMLEVGVAALAASPFAGRGRMLRGMVHLRPGDGYRRLVVADVGSPTSSSPAIQNAHSLPSASAWRWVVERGMPVAIDVNVGVVEAGGAEQPIPSAPGGVSLETRARLLDREVTHLFAIPLRAPGGTIDGMISMEADCRAAIGRPFVFTASQDTLQQMTDVAELFLCTLPLRTTAAPVPDEHLPVIGASMAAVIQMLGVFAQQEETLLLSGPTGAGKSRLARWCHARSSRAGKVFETLDLSTVPEELQMAELVGWRKGAFTGAVKDTAGALTRAEGGSLFVDEVDKLSLKAQAGLLRVLEERRYRPLGDSATEKAADVRFLVGTNTRLAERVRGGTFREDLYFRINVLPLRVPPLTERRDEIALWAAHMLDRRRNRSTGGEASLSEEAKELLRAQPWPGNLRQLDNIVRRAYALALMDGDAAANALVIEALHVQRALAYEEGGGNRSLMDLFHLTAAEFVNEAQRRRAAGGVLDLDFAEALRGFAVGIAIEREGSKEAALRLLGKGVMVDQRNYSKLVQRDLGRVEAFCRLLGERGSDEDEAERPPGGERASH
jgi:DNA-binding NtrC family response regulator